MTLPLLRPAALLGASLLVAGCATDQTVDHGIDAHPLEELVSEVWVAPNGCNYWLIDDGLEGYLAPALNLDGTPVCGEAAQ